MQISVSRTKHDYLKWGFFALMALCTLVVLYADERFWFDPNDPEWRHIAPFKWQLLVHAPFGAIALLLGPLQFSDTIRRTRPHLHRWTGRVYIGAVTLASLVAANFGPRFEPKSIQIEQYFQSGFWFLCTAVALICILTRRIAQHKIWMMRSYGFCLVFVLSRVPDAIPGYHMSEQTLSDMLWGMVIAALIVPDLVLTSRELLRGH
jgi:hypothetical protein